MRTSGPSPTFSFDLGKTHNHEPLLPASHVSEDISRPLAEAPHAPLSTRVLHFVTKALILSFAVWGLISAAHHLHHPDDSPPDCSCGGTTIAEAKRRGCTFSPLAISWLPPHCLDEELSDQFNHAGPGPDGAWPYWADRNMTVPLTIEEVGNLAPSGHFYTTQGWHVTHCMYQWRKELRSKFTGKKVEIRNTGVEHTEHCEMVVKMSLGLDDLGTISGVSLDANIIGGLLDG
ncbi:Cytoskeletal protein syp1 [Elsinoe australis]|uniref:Cytoskeletal protein syp1 n=1 Tax=Elsinoe australis TaxID=40998 RepID=A0A2P8A8H8_9PEZI|nr:Cytoskeletal protein syp1 [Elsinoe australis]